jgi:tRNA pseudouridine32 synthase/23S rRNA pseudouridine746 synthase
MNTQNDITILYHDKSIVVVCKPGGMLAVPGRGPQKQDCAARRLRLLFPEMIDQPAVHRLDMFTSGIMVFAKTAAAQRSLSIQFAKRVVHKTYHAMVEGRLPGEGGEIRLAFRLDPHNRPRQVYDPLNGKLGITTWKALAEEGLASRVEFIPHTGRTHQLRLHAAHTEGLNCPIIGDSLYGSGSEGDQMMLHATSLKFCHPSSGETIAFSSPAPF